MKYSNKRIARLPSLLLIALVLSLVSGCKTKTAQPDKPATMFDFMTEQPPLSSVTIPVSFPVAELERNINLNLPKVIYEDNSSDLKIKAVKTNNVTVRVIGKEIRYMVPLHIDAAKDLSITEVRGNGDIKLVFSTAIDIDNDWTFEPHTTLSNWEWTKAPVLNVSGLDIPIKMIADKVLGSTKKTITDAIDDQLRKTVDLQAFAKSLWTLLQQPVEISPEYKLWLKLTPQNIGMSNIEANGNMVRTFVKVEGISELYLGGQPSFRPNSSLPTFNFITRPPTDSFMVQIPADVPYIEAESIARNMMVGQEYAQGNKKVKIENIKLFPQNQKVVIDVLTSGYYNGSLYFAGKPTYNAESNKLEVDDLDFDLGTKNFLLKSASWLFQKALTNKIKSMLSVSVGENLTSVKQTLQQQISKFQLTDGVELNGKLDELNIAGVRLGEKSMRLDFKATGKMGININKL